MGGAYRDAALDILDKRDRSAQRLENIWRLVNFIGGAGVALVAAAVGGYLSG